VEKPLRLGIPQTTRDSHFPTAATTTNLRLHFQCLDNTSYGYILRWLDRRSLPLFGAGCFQWPAGGRSYGFQESQSTKLSLLRPFLINEWTRACVAHLARYAEVIPIPDRTITSGLATNQMS
jgi:hypothetical protein